MTTPQERKVIAEVATFGYNITNVSADDTNDGFSFRLGLFETFKHPEIKIFGHKPDWRMTIIQNLAYEIERGKRYQGGMRYSDMLVGFDCEFRPVHVEWYRSYLG